jgi:hypothetical protein
MCLSESVYKVVDYGVDKATEILRAIMEGFPPGLVSLKRVQWSQPYAQHRYASGVGLISRLLLRKPVCLSVLAWIAR